MRISASTSCVDISSGVTVTVNENPTIVVGTPPVQCGGTVDLSSLFIEDVGLMGYYSDNLAASSISSTVSSTNTYYAQAIDGYCKSVIESILLTINEIPTAILTTETIEICDDGTEAATLQLSVTGGTPDYTASLSNVDVLVLNSESGIHTVTAAGVYTITGVTDANNCSNTMTNTGTVTVTERVNMEVSNVVLYCIGNGELTISFDVTGGESDNYAITGIAGGSFSGGSYTSDPLLENIAHSFGVEDGTSCNYITGLSYSKTCDCPEIAVLSIDNPVETDTSICGAAGVYTIENFTGNCQGNCECPLRRK